MNNPNRVILHCAVTPDYPSDSPNFDKFTILDIDKWHRKRGFRCCGYHYVITRSGLIQVGRGLTEQGAHTKGYNVDSIGICYIGTSLITEKQILSLVDLYKQLRDQYNIDWENWYGHYEFTKKKTCPNLPMSLMRMYLQKVS